MTIKKSPPKIARAMTKKQFMARSKPALVKENTEHVKVCNHVITNHAQFRMGDRDIPAADVIRTLKKAEHICQVNKVKNSYEKHGKRVTVCMIPNTNKVKTLYELDYRDAKKYKIKWEPMSNLKKNDPHVIEYQMKSKPKIDTEKNQFISSNRKEVVKSHRKNKRR